MESILVSLGFSFMGDIFLGLADYSNIHSLNKNFVLGVASFAAAHVIYAVLFGQMVGWSMWDAIVPIMLVGLTYVLSKFPGFDFKGCLKFVLPYAFVLGIMLMKAMAVDSTMIKIAAILFVFSDFLLIFKYFYNKSKPWMTVINLLSYYSAQIIFALSILTIS
ncbi:MAG: lysoplasmalogenase family protein [Cellulosilyticaceae bacterium]